MPHATLKQGGEEGILHDDSNLILCVAPNDSLKKAARGSEHRVKTEHTRSNRKKVPHEDFQPVIRRVLTLCGMCVAASCGDPSAPSPMTLTLAPASATATGVRGMNGVFSQVTCDLAFTVTAHGGGSSDSIGLSSVTLDWTYAGGFTAQTVETSLVDWFGSNRLAHDASLSAHRSASATTAFTLHVGLHYLTPDGATQLQSFTLVCN